jgi:hypothetical protein
MDPSGGRRTSGRGVSWSHGGRCSEKKREGVSMGLEKSMEGNFCRIEWVALGENDDRMARQRQAANSAIRSSMGSIPHRAKHASVEVDLKTRSIIRAISLWIDPRSVPGTVEPQKLVS